MQIGGLQKLSLIDYPQKLAAVLFTQGCNFRCHFCHNPSLVKQELFLQSLTEEEIFQFLKKRKNQLDGVVITGGEPTLQKDLIPFIQKIKKLGYSIKLDTSGVNFSVLKDLLELDLIDYVAMDIKAPLQKYPFIINASIKLENIEESIKLLLKSSISIEFRTTLVPSLHTLEDIISMAKMIQGAPLYVLQTFESHTVLNSDLKDQKAFSKEELEPYSQKAQEFVQMCKIR